MSTESIKPGKPPTPAARRSIAPLLVPVVATLIIAGLTGVLVLRTIKRYAPKPPSDLGAIPTFALTDQTDHPFTDRDLAGKAWVVDFFFSRCTGVCPMLAERMRSVASWLDRDPRYGARTGLLSITVDPEGDTPARLAEYGAKNRVDPARWRLLTGPAGAIEDVIVRGFHVAVGDRKSDAAGKFDILHGSHLVLVDARGRIRGYFDADPAGVERLKKDLARVLEEPAPPQASDAKQEPRP